MNNKTNEEQTNEKLFASPKFALIFQILHSGIRSVLCLILKQTSNSKSKFNRSQLMMRVSLVSGSNVCLGVTNSFRYCLADVRAKQSEIDLVVVESTIDEDWKVIADDPNIFTLLIKFQVVHKSKQNRITLNHLNVVQVVRFLCVPTADAFELNLRCKINSIGWHGWCCWLPQSAPRTYWHESIRWCSSCCPCCLIAKNWSTHCKFLCDEIFKNVQFSIIEC